MLDCNIIVNEFEIKLRHYVPFWTNIIGKGMSPQISPQFKIVMSLLNKSASTIFYKGGLGIKYYTNFDMPLKQKAKLMEFWIMEEN